MKKLLLFLLLGTASLAQTNLPAPFSNEPLVFFPGIPIPLSGDITVSGTVSWSVAAYTSTSLTGRALASVLQPTVTITGGRFYINWSGVQTAGLGLLDPVWLELYASGVCVRAQTVSFRRTNLSRLPVNVLPISVSVLTIADGDGRWRRQSVAIDYNTDVTSKPTIPTSASQVGAVSSTDYTTNRTADLASVAAISALVTGQGASLTGLAGLIATNTTGITSHTANTGNPHGVTKSQVGLGNADNTSDASKPVSTAQQAALNLKQDASTAEPGVLKFATYALAVAGLAGRTKPCRVLIAADEVNNAGTFGKYDYDGTTLIEDLL